MNKGTITIKIKTLQEVGLSENEAVLYSLMLERPRSAVRELETHAPFPRTMLYYVLNQLTTRGLVTAAKEKGRTVYIAEDPERLYDLLAEKEREFERETTALRELVPDLKRRYRLAGNRPGVRTFEGVEEYQKALEDILITKPSEILSYETIVGKKSALEVRDSQEGRRIGRKIKKRILFFENKGALDLLAKRRYDDHTQFRSLTEGHTAPFNADLMLYGGKLLYTSYSDAHEPTAILIEDRVLYDMQKSLFETLWKQGKDRTLTSTTTKV